MSCLFDLQLNIDYVASHTIVYEQLSKSLLLTT